MRICAFCLTEMPTAGLAVHEQHGTRKLVGRRGSRFEGATYLLREGPMHDLVLTTDSCCDECLHALRLLDGLKYLGEGDLHELGRVLTPPPKPSGSRE